MSSYSFKGITMARKLINLIQFINTLLILEGNCYFSSYYSILHRVVVNAGSYVQWGSPVTVYVTVNLNKAPDWRHSVAAWKSHEDDAQGCPQCSWSTSPGIPQSTVKPGKTKAPDGIYNIHDCGSTSTEGSSDSCQSKRHAPPPHSYHDSKFTY